MNRIQAINTARAYLNEEAPRIISELAPVTRRKKDGSLWAKDTPRLVRPEDVHVYLDVYLTSIHLNVRVRYERGAHAFGYYKTSALVWCDQAAKYTPLPLLTAEEVQRAQAEYRALEEEIRELARRASTLRFKAELDQETTTISF